MSDRLQIQFDDSCEYHNIAKSPQLGLHTRPALRQLTTIIDAIYGFSIESPNTGEVWHYVIKKVGTLTIYDEQFNSLWSSSIAATSFPDAAINSFSHAVVSNQLIINSPYLSAPVYGIVGSGFMTAVKVASINPDTTALDLLPGGVAQFADRIVYSYQNQIFITDPGLEIRTIVAENAIAFPGQVLDMFQAGNQGNFFVFTTDSIYVLPADGLAGGQSYQGIISRVTGYEEYNRRNAAYARGKILALTDDGAIDILTMENVDLIKYRRVRKLSLPAGFGDFRDYRIYGTSKGFIISGSSRTCYIDLDNQHIFWYYSDNGISEVIGILKTANGDDIFLSTDKVYAMRGNGVYDGDAAISYVDQDFAIAGTTDITGSLCRNYDNDPAMSPVVRDIWTNSDNTGDSNGAYMRGTPMSATASIPPSAPIIGTDIWSVLDNYQEREFRATRFRTALRGRDLDFELGFGGSLRRIGNSVSLTFTGQGKQRP